MRVQWSCWKGYRFEDVPSQWTEHHPRNAIIKRIPIFATWRSERTIDVMLYIIDAAEKNCNCDDQDNSYPNAALEETLRRRLVDQDWRRRGGEEGKYHPMVTVRLRGLCRRFLNEVHFFPLFFLCLLFFDSPFLLEPVKSCCLLSLPHLDRCSLSNPTFSFLKSSIAALASSRLECSPS